METNMNVVNTISTYLGISANEVREQIVKLSLSEVTILLQAIRDDDYRTAFNIITGSAV